MNLKNVREYDNSKIHISNKTHAMANAARNGRGRI